MVRPPFLFFSPLFLPLSLSLSLFPCSFLRPKMVFLGLRFSFAYSCSVCKMPEKERAKRLDHERTVECHLEAVFYVKRRQVNRSPTHPFAYRVILSLVPCRDKRKRPRNFLTCINPVSQSWYVRQRRLSHVEHATLCSSRGKLPREGGENFGTQSLLSKAIQLVN